VSSIRYLLVFFATVTIAVSGCDCSGSDDESATAVEVEALTDGEPVTFTVDDPGVRYLYRTGYGGARSKLKLADVPVAYRGAVAVHVAGKTDAVPAGEQAYLADLFGAKAGDEATAYLHDQNYLVASSRAGIDAARAAVGTAQLAMERAEMTPGSVFRQHMRTTIVVEDAKSGRVERKQVSVKRGGLEEESKSWGRSVDEAGRARLAKRPKRRPPPTRASNRAGGPWSCIQRRGVRRVRPPRSGSTTVAFPTSSETSRSLSRRAPKCSATARKTGSGPQPCPRFASARTTR
jgi:hypothetical protein